MGVGEGHNKYLMYKNDNFNAPTRFGRLSWVAAHSEYAFRIMDRDT